MDAEARAALGFPLQATGTRKFFYGKCDSAVDLDLDR
jgi:hypothetical protein